MLLCSSSPASPALVAVQRAELCWGGSPKLQHTGNTSSSSGTTQTTASEHFWGSSDRLGFARSGFPSDPLSPAIWTSWDWVTSAHEDLAARGRVGSTLFLFSMEYQKEQTRGKGFTSVPGRLNFPTLQSPPPTESSNASSMQNCPSTELSMPVKSTPTD